MPRQKTFFAFTLGLILLLALTGCGGGEITANPPEVDTVSQSEMPASENSTVDEIETGEANQPTGEENAGQAEEANAPADPEPTADEATAAAVSFSTDVKPILDSRCATCHGGERIEGGLILLSYAELMTTGDEGPVIIPGDAAGSYLAELIEAQKMPKRGPKLTPPQVQTIIDWINQGALDN